MWVLKIFDAFSLTLSIFLFQEPWWRCQPMVLHCRAWGWNILEILWDSILPK